MGRVLVAGGTGNVGQWVVRGLLERDCNVTLLVRDLAKASSLFGAHDNLKVVEIKDLVQPGVLGEDKLWQGVDTVVCCLGPRKGTTAEAVHTAASNLLGEAKRHKVARWLHISSALVSRPWHPIVMLINSLATMAMHWHYIFEQEVRASGVPYTILRPMRLLEQPDKQELPQPGLLVTQGDQPKGKEISVRLVGMVAVESLCGQHQVSTVNRTFELATNAKTTLSSTWDELAHLQPDTPLPVVNHFTPLRTIRVGALVLIASVVFWAFS